MESEGEVGVASTPGRMTVAGRYRLESVVGSGGDGRVWRAYDELLDREVAVKELVVPPGTSAEDRRAAQVRTMREARATARLHHSGVIRIFDVVRTTGRSWIVMEYVQSRSLQDRVTHDGPLAHDEAARVGLAILLALRATHAAGLSHDDVEPQNVLIADDGRVVLTDFGLTPDDRADGSGLDSDLWSLGAVLYYAVEAQPPSAAGSPDMFRHPGPLQPVIGGLLTTDPARRTSAVAALTQLQALTRRPPDPGTGPRSRPSSLGAVRFSPATVAAATPAPVRPAGEAAEPGNRRRPGKRAAAGAVAVVLAASAAGVVAWRHGDQRPVRTVAPTAAAPAAVNLCGPGTATPVTAGSASPVPLPQGWVWDADPAGFALPVPRGWTRTATGGAVCFGDPGGARAFGVEYGPATNGQPLEVWQAAERAAVAGDALSAYRRISMGVLLVSGGGADWEYTWQPRTGPMLHAHRSLLAAGSGRSIRLTWTTRDADWTAGRSAQRTFVDGLRDPSSTASPWAVQPPAH